MSYRSMNSKVKNLEGKIGISRRQKEEALERLLDDIAAIVPPPQNTSENAVIYAIQGSKEDLPIAIELCEKYDVATKIARKMKDVQ